MARASSHDDDETTTEEAPTEAPPDLPEPEGDDVLPLTDFEKNQAAEVAEAEKAEADET